jgi:hypothetical protein
MVNVLNAILGTVVFSVVCVVISFIVYLMFKFAAKEEVEENKGEKIGT